ncbi:MAG: LytTR family DNA-binding domain-containing protein [Candidatus Zixiibacteriota bacterium]
MTPPPIRSIIVDDEPLAREGIRLLLKDAPDWTVVEECANGQQALDAIRRHCPDVVFLDVQMPELSGFDVVRGIPPADLPVIVFITAFDRYALSAFDAHAIDYLVKPVKQSRFQETLAQVRTRMQERRLAETSDRLRTLLAEMESGTSTPAMSFPDRFPIKTKDKIYFVHSRDIDWVEADDYYVRLHANGKSHLLRETLANMESKLDPRHFRRIHRSTIVNVARIKELHPHVQGEYVVVLHDATKLKLSRTYRDALADFLTSES